MTEDYHLTDFEPTAWANAHYGATMLLGSCLAVAVVFRVHYSKTHKGRVALFVGLSLGPDSEKVSLGKTHLESIAFVCTSRTCTLS